MSYYIMRKYIITEFDPSKKKELKQAVKDKLEATCVFDVKVKTRDNEIIFKQYYELNREPVEPETIACIARNVCNCAVRLEDTGETKDFEGFWKDL